MKQVEDFMNTGRPKVEQPEPGQSFLRDGVQGMVEPPWESNKPVDWKEWDRTSRMRENFQEHSRPGGQNFDFDE